MNIVITISNFAKLTGSEIYVYELARTLLKRQHTVTVLTNHTGGEITDRLQSKGGKVYEFFNHPELTPDVVHNNQSLPTTYGLRFFPHTPQVVTVHSPLEHEKPMTHPHIRRYIFVRPEIATLYPNLNGKVIYNGVDMTRFNTTGSYQTNPKEMLFVGTADYLRYKVVEDLVERAKRGEFTLRLIGEGFPEQATWNIEDTVRACNQTASVYMGRTTIEGWACGKQGWIYDVDEAGNIQDIQVTQPPKDMTQFDIEYMTDRILEIYEEVKL